MPAISAVVLVIDRLGAGWLGPYGNTWLDAPNFNRLAAESVLGETVIAESPDLAGYYCAAWSGRHAVEPANAQRTAIPALASHAAASSLLITDDQHVAQQPEALEFSHIQLLPTSLATANADSLEQTELFRFFTAASEELSRQARPPLIWLHSRGMSGAWDAPLELRYQFADEDDPEPPRFVVPPETQLQEDFDPDELLGSVHAYAGQVALADLCLGMLLDALESHPLASQTLFIVTSPRGYPLGEHRRVGPCDQALYGELLHVPLLVRFPGSENALARAQTLLQPEELYSLVANTCGWERDVERKASRLLRELRGEAPPSARAAYSIAGQQRAIRTPAWFLRQSQADGDPQHELFAKPDDRWEANEVSSRCGEIVELLAAELNRFREAAASGQFAERPLAEALYDVWR
jgi:hypothetical protein